VKIQNSVLVIEDSLENPFDNEEALVKAGVKFVEKTTFDKLSLASTDGSWTTILVNCDHFDLNNINLVIEISEKFKNSQLFVLANKISTQAYQWLNKLKNIITIKKPFSSSILEGLLKKLFAEGKDSLSKFPRFLSDEPVGVTVMGSGLLIYTRMKNITATGAFLDYSGFSLQTGDLLKIHILKEKDGSAETNFKMDAQVIWVKNKRTTTDGQIGVGIKFLNI